MKSGKAIGMSYIGDKMQIKPLVLRVEAAGDRQKASVSIADEENGVMLLVPLSAIAKLLKEAEK